MSFDQQVSSIISLYKKHGWNLSRVLLSPEAAAEIGSTGLFENAEIKEPDMDAAWFTRSSSPGQQTWEIRNLTGTPFALLQVFDDDIENDEREALLNETEGRMRASIRRRAKG